MSVMNRHLGVLGAAIAVSGVAAVAFAGSAGAQGAATQTLKPGQVICTPQQYAAFQVRGAGQASGQGVKFSIQHNGVKYLASPGTASAWAGELRTSFGNFPGAGYYQVCAANNNTTNSTVTLTISTDAEF